MAECSVCYKPNSTLRCPTCRTVYCSVEHQKLDSNSQYQIDIRVSPHLMGAVEIANAKITTLKCLMDASEVDKYGILCSIRLNLPDYPEIYKRLNKEHPYVRIFCHQVSLQRMVGDIACEISNISELSKQMVLYFFNLFSVTFSTYNYPIDEESATNRATLLHTIHMKIRQVLDSFKGSDLEGCEAWEIASDFEKIGSAYFQVRVLARLDALTPAQIKPHMDQIEKLGWWKLGNSKAHVCIECAC